MSFFAKIFGSSDSKSSGKPTASAPKRQLTTQQKSIQIQGSKNKLDQKIQQFQQKQKKLEQKIQRYKLKAKQCIANDKKKQAKKLVQQASKYQKQLQSLTLRKRALQGKKTQLQQAQMNMGVIDAMGEAQVHLKNQQILSQKLQDLIMDGQQSKYQQKQIDDKIKNYVQNEDQQQDVDEMLNQLMKQVAADKKKNVQPKHAEIHTKIPTTNKSAIKKDQISDMLNMLA